MFGRDSSRREPGAAPRIWHGEPRIEDLLDDPVTQLVMHRDQVCRDELARLIEGVRETLRRA
jgi:hypothetical protein